MPTGTLMAAILAVAGAAASAQTTTTYFTIRVDNSENSGVTEVVLRASRASSDVVVGWQHGTDFAAPRTNHIYYSSSIDGYQFGADQDIPLPSSWTEHRGSNPMAAASDGGQWWIGAMGRNPTSGGFDRFLIAPKGATNSVATAFTSAQIDNGVLAVGPPQGGGAERLVLTFLKTTTSAHARAVIAPPSTTDYAVGSATGGNLMSPGGSVVLQTTSAPSLEGQTVVVGLDRNSSTAPAVVSAWSPDGATWQDSVSPTLATIPCDSCALNTEQITWFSSDNPAAVLPAGGPYVVNLPAVAADPGDQRLVYMAFLGMTSSGTIGGGREGPDNIDLFIARSTDGGVNFSGNTEQLEQVGERVLHLRDSDLGDEAGSLQFLPSVTVDFWNRVHVLYYVGRQVADPPNAPVWTYKVKLATISQFAVYPHPTSSITTTDLTGDFTLEESLIELKNSRRYLGEYMSSVDARKCGVYCGYVKETSTGPGVFVSVVRVGNVSCEPDPNCWANCDGSTQSPVLNVADFSCFLAKFATGCDTPITGLYGQGPCYANCDASTTVPFLNVMDFSCFLQKFAAGCTQ